MILKNYTKIAIYICDINKEMVILEPEPNTPWVKFTPFFHMNGQQEKFYVGDSTISISVAYRNSGLKDMPEPEDQILYIVNEEVAAHPDNRGRPDVVFPAGHLDDKSNFYVTELIHPEFFLSFDKGFDGSSRLLRS